MKKTYISPDTLLIDLETERILLPATLKVGDEEVGIQYSKQIDILEDETDNNEEIAAPIKDVWTDEEKQIGR